MPRDTYAEILTHDADFDPDSEFADYIQQCHHYTVYIINRALASGCTFSSSTDFDDLVDIPCSAEHLCLTAPAAHLTFARPEAHDDDRSWTVMFITEHPRWFPWLSVSRSIVPLNVLSSILP